jgi:hypothetical protein
MRAFVFVLASAVAVARVLRRHRRHAGPAREIIESRLAALSARIREGGDPEGGAVRDAQAAGARKQKRIPAESLIKAAQLGRTAHSSDPAAHSALDRLQAIAEANPAGFDGALVAKARMEFDQAKRRLQG